MLSKMPEDVLSRLKIALSGLYSVEREIGEGRTGHESPLGALVARDTPHVVPARSRPLFSAIRHAATS